MKKIVKLRKQGNSLVITISKEIIDVLKWDENDYVFVETKEAKNKESYFGSQKILHIERVETESQ